MPPPTPSSQVWAPRCVGGIWELTHLLLLLLLLMYLLPSVSLVWWVLRFGGGTWGLSLLLLLLLHLLPHASLVWWVLRFGGGPLDVGLHGSLVLPSLGCLLQQ